MSRSWAEDYAIDDLAAICFDHLGLTGLDNGQNAVFIQSEIGSVTAARPRKIFALDLRENSWIPFRKEIFRSEVVDELLQDPGYGDVYPVDYRAFGHDIDSVRPAVVKINSLIRMSSKVRSRVERPVPDPRSTTRRGRSGPANCDKPHTYFFFGALAPALSHASLI